MRYCIVLLVVLTGCVSAARKAGVVVTEAANRNQLAALDEELRNAVTPIELPAAPKSDLPSNNAVPTEPLMYYPDLSPFDRNQDAALTWTDFDLDADQHLETGEGVAAVKAIATLEGEKRMAVVKARISAGEAPATVAKEELVNWLKTLRGSSLIAVLLAMVAIAWQKLVQPRQERKIIAKVASEVRDRTVLMEREADNAHPH